MLSICRTFYSNQALKLSARLQISSIPPISSCCTSEPGYRKMGEKQKSFSGSSAATSAATLAATSAAHMQQLISKDHKIVQ